MAGFEMKTRLPAALGIVAVLSCSGSGDTMVTKKGEMSADAKGRSVWSEVTSTEWKALAEQRIFFGHQSVGRNIVDGMVDLLEAHRELPLMVAESRNFGTRPAFYHATVGRNQFPQEKITQFVEVVDRSIGDGSGIAMLKFCYVDVEPATDARALFARYREQVDALKARHPKLTIVHFTMPLAKSESWKGVWRRRLTRQTLERDRNVVRNQYNRLVREAYGGREPVFDLAEIESTQPDGSRLFFLRGADTVYTMVPWYASDAGHLNVAAQRMVAERLLVFLAKLSRGDG
jgi:hypothetical protein